MSQQMRPERRHADAGSATPPQPVSPPVDAGRRLDSLPIGPFHRRMMVLVGLGIFCDSFDNTLSSGVLASMLDTGFSTLEQNSLFLSATFVGLAIGAALAGWLSDRVGRAFAFQFSLGLFGVLALCASFVPTMEVAIALRGLMAVGMGAEYVICYGMITEFFPRGRRGRFLGLLGVFGGIGVSFSSLLGWVVIPAWSWRGMFVIGGIAALITWFLRRGMPESPRWLESRGRYDEAEAIMRTIEASSGVTSPAARGQAPVATPAPATAPAAGSDGTDRTGEATTDWVPVTALFSPAVRRSTIIALVLTVICLFGSYSVTGWMPTFFVEQGMTVTSSLGFSAAIMSGYVVGPLLCMLGTDRLGRRKAIVGAGVLAAAFAALYPFMGAPLLIILVGFVLVAMVAAFLTLCLGTTPELFPTAIRFRGGGFAQTVGRVSLILSPFVVLWLFTGFGIAGVILVVSGLYVVATLVFGVAGAGLLQPSDRGFTHTADVRASRLGAPSEEA